MFENLRADFEAAMGHRTLEKGMWRVLLRIETPRYCLLPLFALGPECNHSGRTAVIADSGSDLAAIEPDVFRNFYFSRCPDWTGDDHSHSVWNFYPAGKDRANCHVYLRFADRSGCKSMATTFILAGLQGYCDVKIGNNVVIVAKAWCLQTSR